MGQAQAHKARFGQTFGMMPQNPAVIRPVQRQRGNAAGLRRGGKIGPARINRRMGKTTCGINADAAGFGARNHRLCRPDHLAAAQMFGIDRQIKQAMAADPVTLGQTDRPGNRMRRSL